MSADEITTAQVPTENKTNPDLTATVAKHYNELQESGLNQRVQSRIFYLRNMNNWIKSMIIAEQLQNVRKRRGSEAQLTVLDLCAGKGGDLLKWKKGRISRLVCADIAGTSVDQAADRFKEMVERNNKERHPSKLFTAEFITADCTKQRLKDMYRCPEPQFDLVSCQFSFHYSFESMEQTEMMLRNAAECLRLGGYFIGTTPNSYELVKRLRASDDMSFGNEIYRVTFRTEDKEKLPLFGAKYDFHLEGVVDCPEFLVYFPLLEKMAAKHGLKLVQRTPFADFFDQHVHTSEGRGLIGRMQALEPYPPTEDVDLMSKESDAYKAAHEKVEKLKADQAHADDRDHRHRKPITVGTLSQSEWEATTIYLAFTFQKVAEGESSKSSDLPEASGESDQGVPTKRHAVDDVEGSAEKVQKTS